MLNYQRWKFNEYEEKGLEYAKNDWMWNLTSQLRGQCSGRRFAHKLTVTVRTE